MQRATIFRRTVLLTLPFILSTGSLAEEKRSPEEVIELSASIMERQVTGGKTMHGGVEPLLWNSSRYLFEGASHDRFVHALDAFNALSDAQVDSISPAHRAVLQRQLWTVSDWLVSKYRRPPTPIDEGFERKVVGALKKAALSKEQIAKLSNPYLNTVKAKRFPTHYDPKQPFKPYLPGDLFAEKGPWVSLDPDFEGAASAQIHSDDQDWRTAFTIFVSLPGGRDATLGYVKELEEFDLPFDTGRGGKVHPKTPQFPKGTRWALVRRALLITKKGEVVCSPLVEGIELRTYHSLLGRHDPSYPKGSPYRETAGGAVAKFDLDSAQFLTGADSLLRALPKESPMPRPFPSRGSHDPFPDLSKARFPTGGLSGCADCHGGPGIQSIASRNLLFRARVKKTPIFRSGTPSQSHNLTIKMKAKTPSWKALREKWME